VTIQSVIVPSAVQRCVGFSIPPGSYSKDPDST
jgi:hypothetical protein